MSEELKPCPFCDGEVQMGKPYSDDGDVTVEILCKACGMRVQGVIDRDDIAHLAKERMRNRWNRRAGEKQ